jgi:hypothetical protein
MSARPNTARTLTYGHTLASAQLDRLERAQEMAEYALANNKLLTPDEITAYKAAITLVRKQAGMFGKLVDLAIPSNLIPATKRRPGRPSAQELAAIQKGKGGRVVVAQATKTTKDKVKAGKTAKTAKAAKTVKPVSRGNTVKKASDANHVSGGNSAPKRRGRPPKAKNVVDTSVTTVTVNTADTNS